MTKFNADATHKKRRGGGANDTLCLVVTDFADPFCSCPINTNVMKHETKIVLEFKKNFTFLHSYISQYIKR